MLQFHLCTSYLEKINTMQPTHQEIIYKKIYEYQNRNNLKNIKNIDNTRNDLYILKIHQPESRIIIEEKELFINNDEAIKVFFIRDIIYDIKFDREYGRLLYGKIKRGEWAKENPLPQEDIDNFILFYKESIDFIQTKSLDPLPRKLSDWLDNFNLKFNNTIFESEEWVIYAHNNSPLNGMIDRYLSLFRLLISEILSLPTDTFILVKKENIPIYQYENKKLNCGILFSKIIIENKEYFLLHYGAHLEMQESYWKECIDSIKSKPLQTLRDYETLSRLSFRSYPIWTLSKDEIWFRIEKSEESNNLSLTNEQVLFLSKFKFPSYINGQAGSGKSTLLYYIFSNTIYYKYLGDINGEIIFLTENEQLLEDTKENVFNLLENNPEFGLAAEELDIYKDCFTSFKNFLLSFLSESDLPLFEDEKYLNFSIFKMKYENSKIPNYIKNEYSAEEAWFVIITYIYGHDINTKTTSNNYESIISKKSQRIPLDRFQTIEQSILPFYESLLANGYWDKLRIIQYINENVNFDIKKKYSVLVCDEAQDFCRVELNFILKQSEYLKYDLSQAAQVPIVFAGDSSQTVNPTGFRDAEITTLIYQELQDVSNFRYNKEATTYKPNLNYRSAAHIVHLANFIQYYRKNNFGIEQKYPQESKLPSQKIDSQLHFNIFLDYQTIQKDALLKESLIKKLQYKIFIIPVDSEEKDIYQQNSDFLSNLNEIEIKSSLEAKGAEYQHIVLCGFGEYFLNKFRTLESSDKSFEKAYYFNKLYVAITRAKTELIIIDSPASKDQFWEKLTLNAEILNQNGWQELQNFKDNIIEYNTCSINHILESTKQDALTNANEDKKLGEHYQNPSRLKVAASQFHRLGCFEEANECYGVAAEITNNYKAAGEYYQKANKLNLASNVFFQGRYFDDLERLGQNLQSLEHDLRTVISRIMKNEYVSYNELCNLSNNKKSVLKIIKPLQWRDEFIKVSINFSQKTQDSDLLTKFVDVLNEISTPTDISLIKEIGRIYFELGNYKEASLALEKIDTYDSLMYYEAKLKYYQEINDNENVVIYLNELIQYKTSQEQLSIYQEILNIHKKSDFESFGNEYYLVIFKAKLFLEDLNEIISFNKIVLDKVYPSEIETFYSLTIKENMVSKDIFSYLILKWAELFANNLGEFKASLLDVINNEYKIQSKKYNIPYKPYSLPEILMLSELNQKPDFSPSEHLSNITIKNFRQFENISLTNIGQFNLIVGDNNIGKTSLLEALLFTTDIDLYYKNLAFAYISRNNITLVRDNNIQDDVKYYELSKTFLYDFFKLDSKNQEIIFELQEDRNQWIYKLKYPTLEEISINSPSIDKDEYICMTNDREKPIMQHIPTIIKNININDIIKVQFIPFGRGFDRTLAGNYYDIFEKNKKMRNEFLNYMKIFIPMINRITADTKAGVIYIEESIHDSSFPLHQYGEGANKLFRILIQIILQKDKKLLIDEIDAGIHYSHFLEFWKIILQVAKENNVQIFATTHNLECIQYFKEMLDEKIEYQTLSKVITLRRLQNNDIKAYTRKYEEFEHELNNEFEIRGGAL